MSYNTAALEGGAYNTAALMGGAYNTAALQGGAPPVVRRSSQRPSYNFAGLFGGENIDESYNTAALYGGSRLRKGSPEAKARMAYLRSLRGKGQHTSKSYLRRKAMESVAKGVKFGSKKYMAMLRQMRGGAKVIWR